MDFVKRIFDRDSVILGLLLGLVMPVVFLYLFVVVVGFFPKYFSAPVYPYQHYYMFSLLVNILLIRYYLVTTKLIKTGSSIVGISFLLMLLIFLLK